MPDFATLGIRAALGSNREVNALLLMTTTMALVAQATPPRTSQLITVRTSGDALFIWDAADAVGDMVKRGTPAPDTMQSLKVIGLRMLMEKCASLHGVSTCALRIIYPHDSEFSTQYNVDMMTSMEQLMTLHASQHLMVKQRAQWIAALDAGRVPSGVTVKVTGSLPPAKS